MKNFNEDDLVYQMPLLYNEATGGYDAATVPGTARDFNAATLVMDDAVVCVAYNVHVFNRAKKTIIFELAEVNPVSKFHSAADKMNTDYFKTRHFEKRGFNAKFCRPATPEETLVYLNAKYKYETDQN